LSTFLRKLAKIARLFAKIAHFWAIFAVNSE